MPGAVSIYPAAMHSCPLGMLEPAVTDVLECRPAEGDTSGDGCTVDSGRAGTCAGNGHAGGFAAEQQEGCSGKPSSAAAHAEEHDPGGGYPSSLPNASGHDPLAGGVGRLRIAG